MILFGNCEVLRFEGAAWEQGGGRLESGRYARVKKNNAFFLYL